MENTHRCTSYEVHIRMGKTFLEIKIHPYFLFILCTIPKEIIKGLPYLIWSKVSDMIQYFDRLIPTKLSWSFVHFKESRNRKPNESGSAFVGNALKSL